MNVLLGQEFEGKAAQEREWSPQGTQEVEGMTRSIEFGVTSGLFRVTVTLDEKEIVSYVEAGHPPEWGIDVGDMAEINSVSEEMVQKLEVS